MLTRIKSQDARVSDYFFVVKKSSLGTNTLFSTDEVLHGGDHQNVIKYISYTQMYSMYVPDMLLYALYIEYAPPDMLHWVCYQLCSNLYWKIYKKEELLK